MIYNEEKYKKIRDELNVISPSFCAAKWGQLTLYLQTGYNHSCHHPSPHKIPLNEVKDNYKALHNTQFKKKQMDMMLNGERPKECEYCWNIEDLSKEHISDRVYKSCQKWSQDIIPEILEKKTEDIEPTYLEISFSNTCNLKCSYCTPDISSQWYQEIEKHGGYPTSENFNNLDYLKSINKLPYKHSEENPYVEAFWKWWPELSPKLNTLRLTGGEPLLSKDVWMVIDKLIETPNPELTFAINTNLCAPDELIDKLISKINLLEGKVKEIQIFTSNEATNKQAEYSRFGMDYRVWKNNLEKVLVKTNNVIVANMTTVNIFSIENYDEFIEYLIKLRIKYPSSFLKMQFMTNYLRYPEFLSLPILDQTTKDKFEEKIYKLIDKMSTKYEKYTNFAEIDQLKRLIDYMNETITEQSKLTVLKKDFFSYINEYDKRRGSDFLSTFPSLNQFYKLCQEI
jgi:MoaA/NifB/PqqE/SkfB family radical SAM enzyme